MTDMFLVRSMIQLAQHEADYGPIAIEQNVTAGKIMLTHESMRLPEDLFLYSGLCMRILHSVSCIFLTCRQQAWAGRYPPLAMGTATEYENGVRHCDV